MVRAGGNASRSSRRKRNRGSLRFCRPRSARNAARLLESRPRPPSLPADNDPKRLPPDPGNPRPEGAHPRLPSATVPQARFRAPLNTASSFSKAPEVRDNLAQAVRPGCRPGKVSSGVGAAHAPIPTTPLLPAPYTPFCNFPYVRGFHEWSKDLRGSPDAIPIVLILKAAISKVLRLTRHLSRRWSLLRF